MEINLLWSGLENSSLEDCRVTTTPAGNNVQSNITGTLKNKTFKLEYSISTNNNWETISAEIHWAYDGQHINLHLSGDGKGNWSGNLSHVSTFKGCIDVDIPLTPFTNTLPINRLKLSIGQAQIIDIIYLDLAENDTRRVRQKYTRLSSHSYRYENVPNDFEAVIKVDDNGLVEDYPGLFTRKSSFIV